MDIDAVDAQAIIEAMHVCFDNGQGTDEMVALARCIFDEYPQLYDGYLVGLFPD